MTRLLEEAFERASELPREEQDKFARFLLAELGAERRWAELFAGDCTQFSPKLRFPSV